MPKIRSESEAAAGKLIAAIQKEWNAAMGESGASVSEEVMHNSHGLLKAAKAGTLAQELQGQSIAAYLGQSWVRLHPKITPFIEALEATISSASNA